jgi:hypothetical protein
MVGRKFGVTFLCLFGILHDENESFEAEVESLPTEHLTISIVLAVDATDCKSIDKK